MKICYLADWRSIHTLRWIKFFAERHDVDLISLDYSKNDARLFGPDEYEKLGVRVHLVGREGAERFSTPFKVRGLIKKIQPDIVHSHYASHYGFLGAFSGFHPLVITAWGSDVLIEPQESFSKNFQVKYALKRGDLFTCDGENTAIKLAELGANKDRIARIYFGVDTTNVNPNKSNPELFKKYLKDKSSLVILNIRGFSSVYDPDTFINAIPLVLTSFPNTVFAMAREGEERKKYMEKVKDMGIEQSVAFIGNIPSVDMPSFLASADIYVSMSVSDSGISAATAEAMASGIPVISTNVADIGLWVKDGQNGFVIPKGSSQDLADRLNYLLSNENVRKSMGQEARRTIVERQDYRTEMAKMGSIYMRLVEEGTK